MLEKYEQALEQWIGEIVAGGDDDALFASGYLQGHFAWCWPSWKTSQNKGRMLE